MFSMEDVKSLVLIIGALFLLGQLIAVLAGRLDKKALLETVKTANSNVVTLDMLEAHYAKAQESVKLLIGLANTAVDFLGKSIPVDSPLGFAGEFSREVDKLLDKVTDGLPNAGETPITVITPPPDPKPDIEPVG